MSFSIVQVVFILFTSISLSKHNVVVARTPPYSLDEICNQSNVKSVIDPNICLKILQSQKKIVSSTNEIDFSLAVIEAGISNATNTKGYVENTLKTIELDPILKGALQDCKSSYDLALVSFRSAFNEVKAGEYLTPTYDLLIASTDNIQRCQEAVDSKKIEDGIIFIGNKVLPMFGYIGYNVIEDLYRKQPSPPGYRIIKA